MSLLHSRCNSLEALLRGRISDLEAEVDRLRESEAAAVEAAAIRERALVDRLIAVTNPLAARAIANLSGSGSGSGSISGPAAGMPVVDRSRGLTKTPPRPTSLPGNRQRPMENRTGVGPALTPKQSGYRPEAAAAAALAAEEAEPLPPPTPES